MSYQKLFESAVSNEYVELWKSQGKKVLGYVCCHVPEELFYAADILPVRLRATGCIESSESESWMSSFSCSYARSILQHLINSTYNLDGIILSDGCMMATRILDNWEHIAKLNGKKQYTYQLDAPRITNEATIKFYREELQILADKLGKFSGKKVTDDGIRAAVEKSNEMRSLISKLYALRRVDNPVVTGADALSVTLAECDMPINQYIGLLKEFLADAENRQPVEPKTRLIVIGSALDNPEYLKIIENTGCIIAADAYCFGDRAFGSQIELDEDDVIGSLARYYLSRNTCPRALDNRPALHQEIVNTCKEYNIQGVIYQKVQNCECWGGESYYLEPALKEIGVPMLQVEREEKTSNSGQLAVRVEAFIEMLEGQKGGNDNG